MANRARGTTVVNVSDIALTGNALNAQPTSHPLSAARWVRFARRLQCSTLAQRSCIYLNWKIIPTQSDKRRGDHRQIMTTKSKIVIKIM